MSTTIKLPLKQEINIEDKQSQWSKIVRIAYNRLKEGLTTKQIKEILPKFIKNNIFDVSWTEHAIAKAQGMLTTNAKVIFGSKNNFWLRKYNKITKEEFKKNRLLPIYSRGRALDRCGNRKFELDINNDKIIFKFNRKEHIELFPYMSKNQKNILLEIQEKAKAHEMPVTYTLSNNYVCITYDESYLAKKEERKETKDRVLSLDLNPNYIGFSVCDWSTQDKGKTTEKKVVYSEVISNKQINDMFPKGTPSTDPLKIYITNKRKHESYEISKYISNLASRYGCEVIAIEDLNIKSKDIKRGKRINRLINNQWNRRKFVNNLKKRNNLNKIRTLEIQPQYSSFIGQMQNQNCPDMVAAAIEIGRRAFLFNKVYVKKEIEKVPVIFPMFDVKTLPTQWKKMALTHDIKNWVKLYELNKKMKLSYRLPLGKTRGFRLKSPNSKILRYSIVC